LNSTTEQPAKRPEAGVGVLILRGSQVLLGKRLGAHGEGYYAPPGGHIEAGESIAQTARREVVEECGLEIVNIRLASVGTYCIGDNHYYVDVDVVCESLTGEPLNLEPDRCEGWAWNDLDAFPSPLFIVAQRIIASIQSGEVLTDLETVYCQSFRYEEDDVNP